MSDTIHLIAFGTFGNPNGFTQTFFIGNSGLSKAIRTFDINTSALNLFPGSKVYSIRKNFVNEKNIIAYSVYTYAKEQNSTRGGTFIGSSILFIDEIAEENITINCLNDFHDDLSSKNVENDIIRVTHSDKFSVSKPKDFDKLPFNLRVIEDLNFIQSTSKQLVVYSQVNAEKLQLLFKESLTLLNVYDTIYFTESSEVAEFVHQKGIFPLIKKEGFEQEIEAYQEEIKRKIIIAAANFEKEVQRLAEDRNKTLEDFRDQIEQNYKLHQENERKIEESKSDLKKVESIYNDFSAKIKDLANQLRSGKKLADVQKVYNENKIRFIEGVGQLKKPNFINKISKASAKTALRAEHTYDEYEGRQYRNSNREEKKEYSIDPFKVATAVLLLLLVGTWVYFLFFNAKKEAKPVQTQRQQSFLSPGSTLPQVALAAEWKEATDLYSSNKDICHGCR